MNGQAPFWIRPGDTSLEFPDAALALREPDGLLAIGGDLQPERLLAGYRQGVFPWYSDDQPILWWSPDPRTVLYPGRLRISRSLRKTLRRRTFTVTLDRAFESVIEACAAPRRGASGTWITGAMASAYMRLHQLGFAHSVECWADRDLVGGLYGVAIGKVFFGESMFSRAPDTSKVALAHLERQLLAWDFGLIDCQVYSPHLTSLGAEQISRAEFVGALNHYCASEHQPGAWTFNEEMIQQDW